MPFTVFCVDDDNAFVAVIVVVEYAILRVIIIGYINHHCKRVEPSPHNTQSTIYKYTHLYSIEYNEMKIHPSNNILRTQ